MGYDTKLTAYHKKIELVVQLEADLSEARSGIIEAYKDVWPFPNCKTLKQFQEERLKRSLMAQIWRADAPSREKIALEESHARIRYVFVW